MAKKKTALSKAHRADPKFNKSLAVRRVLHKLPAAKASDIVDVVKKEYGHEISPNMVYMVKTKSNMAADGRPLAPKGSSGSPMTSPAHWVDAIKVARQLLRLTGSVANATALLKAIDG